MYIYILLIIERNEDISPENVPFLFHILNKPVTCRQRITALLNKLGCVYTCLTQLYDGRDMYNLLHKDQLHVSALFIGHLQVGNLKLKSLIKQLYYTWVGI